ncbi:hypothetical protein [Actinotalea sp. Marseille-Q4924]|uniref:hypothetical protein n=1 Tax=Actinotalea sp. Marseille-Q4924 TaxID=2866571 RepID=UPI001CE4A6CB|nr:hypothetical protein [Actinotalea sp. Marseille-Q4924]
MTPESLAESIEKTRFELMRGQHWSDLRASERETRVDLARRALEESGVAAQLDAVRRQADRVPDLEDLVSRHEAEILGLESRLAEETAVLQRRLESERSAHAAQVADLEGQLAAVRHQRDRAEARVAATEAVVAGVRDLVTAPIEIEPDDDAAEPEHVGPVTSVPNPATEGGGHNRRPIFRMARSAPAT